MKVEAATSVRFGHFCSATVLQGVEANVVTYNTAMTACERGPSHRDVQ